MSTPHFDSPWWQDFNDHAPDDGTPIYGRFGTQAIECTCEFDGFYMLEGDLITDSQGYRVEPDARMPLEPKG